MKKRLVKVVGTIITGAGGGRLESKMGRGIVALDKEQSLIDFIKVFLSERSVVSFTLNQRGEHEWATSPMMYLTSEPKLVITFNFIEFPATELGFYAKDLSKAEQARDFKLLKRYMK